MAVVSTVGLFHHVPADIMGEAMKGETSREPHYFTSGEWVNKREVLLSGWPINKRALSAGRLNAGGTNMAKKLLARMDKEGKK